MYLEITKIFSNIAPAKKKNANQRYFLYLLHKFITNVITERKIKMSKYLIFWKVKKKLFVFVLSFFN